MRKPPGRLGVVTAIEKIAARDSIVGRKAALLLGQAKRRMIEGRHVPSGVCQQCGERDDEALYVVIMGEALVCLTCVDMTGLEAVHLRHRPPLEDAS